MSPPATTPPRRADARRNVAAILDAAQECLIRDPEATVAQIAQAAGVGRVTLYGHFATRTELVDAVFERVTAQADTMLAATDVSGDPTVALARLVTANWQVVHRFRAVLAAAERELPPARVRGHNDRHLRRLTALLARGRAEGAFRTDLPEQWLATTAYTLMHAAAHECAAGRLDPVGAGVALTATLTAAFAPPPPPGAPGGHGT